MNVIEKTIRYATSVDDLPDAWTFVMDHLETVGPSPSIGINPRWVISDDPDEHGRYFEVTVSGMVEA